MDYYIRGFEIPWQSSRGRRAGWPRGAMVKYEGRAGGRPGGAGRGGRAGAVDWQRVRMGGLPRRSGARARTPGVGVGGWGDIQMGQEVGLFGGWAGSSPADVGWLGCVRAGRVGRWGHVGSWAWCRRNRGKMGAGCRAGVGDLAYGGGQWWRGEVDDVLREIFSLPALIHARCHGSSRQR